MSKELDYITELERKNRLLGERCNQLLKDKGDLTDQIADIKANCDLAIEGRDVKIMELEKENAELKNKLTEKVTLESLDVVSAKMNDLEKENAELRNNGFTVSAMTEQQLKAALEKGEQLEKQLEVAKDLIHQFLIQNPISDWLPKKAEQFLKEIEK